MKKDVVVLGKGNLAVHVAKYFHEKSDDYRLVCVVPNDDEPAWAGAKLADYAYFRDIPCVTVNDITNIDIAFSIYHDRILKKDFIDRCGRIFNLHNGPLPRYRGVRPVNWALKNGENEHGVTIHEISPGIDDGPIIAQVKFSIYPEIDEVWDVYLRCLAFGKQLFDSTIERLNDIIPRPQDHGQATIYYSKQNHLLGDRTDWRRWVQ